MQLYDSNEFRASPKWPYAISSGCVVYRMKEDDLEVLLLVRLAGAYPQLPDSGADSYHLPKGHVNIGETLEQTAARETAEEAGCEVSIETYLGAKIHKHNHFGMDQDKTVHYFAGQWVKDLISMDEEHSHRTWYPAAQAIELTKHNPKREDEMISRVQDFLKLQDAS